jgi:hypothetical protein
MAALSTQEAPKVATEAVLVKSDTLEEKDYPSVRGVD